jgi:hypothetical protein
MIKINLNLNVNELLFIEQSIKARIEFYSNSVKPNSINYINDLSEILNKIQIIKKELNIK